MRSEIGIDIDHDVNIHLENRQESNHFFWFIWLLYAVVMLTKNCFNAALTSIVAEGILTKSQTGNFSTFFYLVYAPLQIVGGLAADRYSPEKLIKIGLVGAALSNIVIFFNQNYYVMLAAWMFNGAIQFGLWPGVFKIVSSQLVRSERTTMTFFISFSASFGLILSYLIGALITDWRMNFVVSAVILLVFAVILHLFCRHLNPYMKWDRKEQPQTRQEGESAKMPAMKLFLISGFFVMVVVSFLRTTLDQAGKTLAPIMLMESYENMSPSISNILNILVLLSGVGGMILVRKLLYPKRVQNELKGLILTVSGAIPAMVVMLFLGKIGMAVALVAFCVICAVFTSSGLFTSFYSNCFVKYGKSATVAGALNAAAAVGMIAANYGFMVVAEVWNWQAVTVLWIVLLAVMIALVAAILPTYRKFKQL